MASKVFESYETCRLLRYAAEGNSNSLVTVENFESLVTHVPLGSLLMHYPEILPCVLRYQYRIEKVRLNPFFSDFSRFALQD